MTRRILPRGAGLAAIAVAAALTAATATAAPGDGGDQRGDEARKRKDPNEVVCRRERVTGSHMRQKICHTRAEWDELREESQRMMRDRPHHNTERPQ
tara:strand:- start:3159 stop:3449 length:291 start_codon:yes stop_codon:yes gene_type:complete